jgi:AcrR family transcriptional regulator
MFVEKRPDAPRSRQIKVMVQTKRKSTNVRRQRGRPRLEEVATLEAKLLSTALEEFQQHGYGAASVNAIAKAACVSKTTLYSRFPSKESLFRAIMREQIDVIAGNRIHQLFRDSRLDISAGLEAYANYMLDLSFKGRFLMINRLIYSESHRFPELGAAAAERSQLGIQEIADFISHVTPRRVDRVDRGFVGRPISENSLQSPGG